MIAKAKDLRFDNKKIFMIIAGVPGIGKTTLALSSPNPLLIDLDKGISRVEARYRTDTDVVNNYEELVNDLNNSDLTAYETIVIDTGGKLLDFLKPVVIKDDQKNGKRDGNLSLQGYGAVKKKFSDFVKNVKALDKHLIMIFHATEVSLANDVTGLRIRLEGSSKDDVWDDVDIGGFMEMIGNNRTIGFTNCERYYAKGTHGIHGVYQIPQLDKTSKNTFVTDLFNKVIDDLNSESDDLAKYQEVMSKFNFEDMKNLEDVNLAFDEIKKVTHYLTSKEELWFKLTQRAKELGFAYDKQSGKFN